MAMVLPKLTKQGNQWYMNDGLFDEVTPRDPVHGKRFKKTFDEVDAALHKYMQQPTEKLLHAIAMYAHVLGESYEEHMEYKQKAKSAPVAKKKPAAKKKAVTTQKPATKKITSKKAGSKKKTASQKATKKVAKKATKKKVTKKANKR